MKNVTFRAKENQWEKFNRACKSQNKTRGEILRKAIKDYINNYYIADKKIKVEADDIKSIDPDYKGQEYYHSGEKVEVVNPDSKYYKRTGKYIGTKTKDRFVYHIINIKGD